MIKFPLDRIEAGESLRVIICRTLISVGVSVSAYYVDPLPKSIPHLGKQGIACMEGERLRILLDDRCVIYGDECYWVCLEDSDE